MQDIKSFCQENGISEQAVQSFVKWFQLQAKKNPQIIQWLEVDAGECMKKAFQEYEKQMKAYFEKLKDKESKEYKQLVEQVYEECRKK